MTHTTEKTRTPLALRGALMLFTLLAILSSLAFARTLLAKREFTAPLKVKLCGKTADGKWTVLDSFEVPSAKVSASLVDLASAKGVNSSFAVSGRTQMGKQVSVRMVRDGRATANLTTGFVEVDLPIEIAIDGKRTVTNLKMTTETAAGPDGGTISGKRGVIDTASRSARIGFVGTAKVEQAKLNEALDIIGKRPPAGDAKRFVELIFVAQAEGVLRAVEQ